MKSFSPLLVVRSYIRLWWELIKKISSYPLLFCLLGGITLMLQQGTHLTFQIGLFFAWLILTLPLWFLGQHWVIHTFSLNSVDITMLNSDLLGLHVMLFALMLLAIMIIIHSPKLLFAEYFSTTKMDNALDASVSLAKDHYSFLLWRLILLSGLSLIIQVIITFILTSIPAFFFTLYSPTYIIWTDILRVSGNIMGSSITTALWMYYFYKLWQKIKKEPLKS